MLGEAPVHHAGDVDHLVGDVVLGDGNGVRRDIDNHPGGERHLTGDCLHLAGVVTRHANTR